MSSPILVIATINISLTDLSKLNRSNIGVRVMVFNATCSNI